MAIKPILALDTTTEACSAAILTDNACTAESHIAPQQHSQIILPLINQLLDDAECGLNELGYIAVTQGPGSFTGVRLGISAAQGLSFALNVPVVELCTLEVMAYAVWDEAIQQNCDFITVALDARMGELYYSHFPVKKDSIVQQGPLALAKPEAVAKAPAGKGIAVGSGFKVYGDTLFSAFAGDYQLCHENHLPNAEAVAKLAAQKLDHAFEPVSCFDVKPLYVRNQVAQPPASN